MNSEVDRPSQEPVPDTHAIRMFFETMGQSIHVFTTHQDGGSPIGRYFGNDANAAAEFAEELNHARSNVYFTVNEPSPDCGHKPGKAQILRIRAAHVDIDPYKPGARFDKEAAHRALLADTPSLVIDSGNGLHVYWILAEAVPATPENVASIEAVNRALVARFGGDPAAINVDRVLRVPGTVNWPNKAKRDAGRVPCMAKVLA